MTDAELLRRYVTDRDEIAFAELVHRHAPAVYAVCRRHLNRSADLDDAFQATFVVLARRAGELTHPDRLSGWLCGTADRIARKARQKSAKRAGTEQPLESVAEPSASVPESEADLKAVLDDELRQLPDEYRQAVLLCDVEQVGRREAAKRLGIPDGTLSNRLTRARAMLGRRLVRRGVTLGIGIGSAHTVEAAVPIRLIARTVRQALSEPIPAGIESLITNGWKPMSLSKSLLAAVVGVSALSATVVGVVVMTRGVNSSSTADGEGKKGAKPQTPTTGAISDSDLAKMPHPKPRVYYDRYTRVSVTSDGNRVVLAPYDLSIEDTKI